MKIYEVFVCVPYFDPDYNECYERHNGTLFQNKNDAESYLRKMFDDEKANYDLCPELLDVYDEDDMPVRRYVTLSDYTETEIRWIDFCCTKNRETIPEERQEQLREIFKTNFLVEDIKSRDALLLTVTYGGNRWFLRETELN